MVEVETIHPQPRRSLTSPSFLDYDTG
jgi:hypothetical protein